MIESTDQVLKKGSVVCFEGKIILSANWCSITSFSQEYEYEDEMICNGNQTSPFRIWRHKHKFEIIEIHKTRVVDLIEFELPYGVLGKGLEIYIIYQLKCIFRYREQATKECLTKIWLVTELI